MLLELLRAKLSTYPRFTDKHGQLLPSAVIDAALALDPSILEAVISEPELKQHFMTEVKGVEVFDKTKFVWVVDSKSFLPDSYTAYKNMIGLVDERGSSISQSTDVALVWPYKDCILEGGQTKEEAKTEEVFYNEILSQQQVTKLLSPKVLSKARRYSPKGTSSTTEFNDDDNLLIKGNNLIALTTLQPRYTSKIKFIYIDPPYNTGDDSFSYNDRFSRSTWLTFMKNRVEEAKKLLSNDGVLAIQISFHEGAYLQVMLDGIEGLHHLLSMHVLVRHPERTLTSDKSFNDVMEMVLLYSRDPNFQMPKRVKEKTNDEYIYEIRTLAEGTTEELGGKTVTVYQPDSWELRKVAPNAEALKSYSIRGSLREGNSSGRFYVANIEPNADSYEPQTLFKVPNMGDDGLGYRWFHTPKAGNKNGTYFQGMPKSSSVTLAPYANFQDFTQEYNRVSYEGGVDLRRGKKPEALIEFLLNLFTNPGDRVLDYHFGSGTTGAAAQKMGRKWVGVEQLDYIHEKPVERLKNVIAGEQSGISERQNWAGGGSFIYCELAEHNQSAIAQIQSASSSKDLAEILETLIATGDLRPDIFPEQILAHDEVLYSLDFEEQKFAIMELINKSRLYVSYADIEDETYMISEEDKAFSRSFYGEND